MKNVQILNAADVATDSVRAPLRALGVVVGSVSIAKRNGFHTENSLADAALSNRSGWAMRYEAKSLLFGNAPGSNSHSVLLWFCVSRFFLFCDCLHFCWSIFGLSAVGRQPSRQAMLMVFAVIWNVKLPALALYHRDKLRKDILHSITPHHPASHHTMSRHTTPHHTTPSHTTPRHITQPRITPRHPHTTPHRQFYT